MNGDLEIAICIVTHNRPDLLRRVLAALAECGVPDQGVRTLVVENGGCHDSEEVARQASDTLGVEYLPCGSPAKSAALNLALRHIDRGLVAFIDDDALPSPGWIKAYADAYARYGRGHYFGGPFQPDYDVPPPEWLLRFLPPSAVGWESTTEDMAKKKRQIFLGFNWAAEVEDLKACGGFSNEFGPGVRYGVGDERFMQFQLAERGITSAYVPDAMVRHYVPATRCSSEWCLGRVEGGAFSGGIAHEHFQRTHRLPVRSWRALLRHVRRRTRRGDITSMLKFQTAGRHWLRHLAAWQRGFRAGVRYGANHHPLDADRWAANGLGQGVPKSGATIGATSSVPDSMDVKSALTASPGESSDAFHRVQ